MTSPRSGLRRFARPNQPPSRPAQAVPTASGPPGTLPVPGREPAPQEDDVERCEMCATPLDDRHGHLVDLERRSLACTCRACYLLFTASGAGRGRYRAVPEDVHRDPARPLDPRDWDALQVPVGTVFFFVNSDLDRVVGCYPSPGGATECELDLAEWTRLEQEYPLLGALEADVQAIFVHRSDAGLDYFRVPIDACYALVGEVRLRWSGLDGGEETRETVAAFVDDLRQRSRSWHGASLHGASSHGASRDSSELPHGAVAERG